MPKAVIIVYENGQNGPGWKAAQSAFELSEFIEGAAGVDASKPDARAEMQRLGISAPSIIIGRYCNSDGQIKIRHIAKMPTGIPSPQAIANAAATIMQDASASACSTEQGPIPTTQSGSGNDEDQGGGFGLNPWGIFSLPFDAPWWLWALIAGGAAVGSTSADGKISRYGWGAVAVVAGGNAVNAYKKSKDE